MSNLLATINKAKAELAIASSLASILEIRDKAEAIRVYAKAASDSLEVQNKAAEIKLRAERRAGELLKEMDNAKTGRKKLGNKMLPNPDGVDEEKKPDTATLNELGITKMQSSRWQKESEVAEEKFEEYVEECQQQQKEVTQSGLLAIAGAGHVSASTGENEWYTPIRYLDAARLAMGDIDLDPATCESAQANVKAKGIYTIDDDGLEKPWRGRVWLNPPYSKDLCSRFIEKLRVEILNGNCLQACVLVNNATETQWGQVLLGISDAVCFPSGRIQFLSKDGKKANSPLQGQMICYVGGNPSSFVEAFEHIGVVLRSTTGGDENGR